MHVDYLSVRTLFENDPVSGLTAVTINDVNPVIFYEMTCRRSTKQIPFMREVLMTRV